MIQAASSITPRSRLLMTSHCLDILTARVRAPTKRFADEGRKGQVGRQDE